MKVMFSIIVATCDRPGRLEKALKAIGLAIRTSGQNHCVIVVDNGLRSSAEDVVTAFQSQSGTDVRYLRSEPRNKSVALNVGIKAADTEWLAFTDDDAIPDPAWLREASTYISRYPVRIFGGKIVAGEPGSSVPCWLKEGRTSSLVQYPAIVRYEPLSGSGILGVDAIVPFGANLFVDKQVFEKYGSYDEELWAQSGSAALGIEDSEFAIRVRSTGEHIGYCAEAVVVHPVYGERATLRHHLQWSYRAGIREVILFGGVSSKTTFRYLAGCFLRALWRLMCSAGKGEWPACVGWLMKIMTVAGETFQRFSHPARINIWQRKWCFWLWGIVKTHPIPAGWLRSLVTRYYANATSRDLLGLYSGEYYDVYRKSAEQERLIKKMQALVLRRAFPNARRILVGGCADGMLVAMLRAEGAEAFGFDLSPSIFSLAQPEIRPFLRIGSMGRIPFSPLDHFDLFVAVDVVEHVPRNAVPSMVRQIVQLGVPSMALVINHKDLGCPGHVTMMPLEWWQKKMDPFFVLDPAISFDREGLVPVYSLDDDPDSQFTFWRRKEAVL